MTDGWHGHGRRNLPDDVPAVFHRVFCVPCLAELLRMHLDSVGTPLYLFVFFFSAPAKWMAVRVMQLPLSCDEA